MNNLEALNYGNDKYIYLSTSYLLLNSVLNVNVWLMDKRVLVHNERHCSMNREKEENKLFKWDFVGYTRAALASSEPTAADRWSQC